MVSRFARKKGKYKIWRNLFYYPHHCYYHGYHHPEWNDLQISLQSIVIWDSFRTKFDWTKPVGKPSKLGRPLYLQFSVMNMESKYIIRKQIKTYTEMKLFFNCFYYFCTKIPLRKWKTEIGTKVSSLNIRERLEFFIQMTTVIVDTPAALKQCWCLNIFNSAHNYSLW